MSEHSISMKDKPEIVVVLPFPARNELIDFCLQKTLLILPGFVKLLLLPDLEENFPFGLNDFSCSVSVRPTGKCNPARKRNFVRQFFPEADLYIFLDSDAWPENGWIEALLHIYESEKAAPAFGGPNFSLNRNSDRSVEYALCSFLVSPATWQAKYNFRHDLWLSYLPSCNLAVRGEVFRGIGGFDESLNFGEDMDLCDRIRKQYGRILYSSKPVIRHYTRELFRPFFRQKFTYGYSLPRLWRKHGEIWFYPFCLLLLFGLFALIFMPPLFFSTREFIIFLLFLGLGGLFLLFAESWRVCRSFRAVPGTMLAIGTGLLALLSGACCAFFGKQNK